MNGAAPAGADRWGSLVPTGVLLLVVVLFATATSYPWVLAVGIAVGGTAVGVVVQRGRARSLAPIPVIGTFVALAVAAPATPATDLLGGVGGLALLLWIAAEPGHRPRAIVRSLSTVASTGLILLIAWTSALLLPRSPALLGIGGALLVTVVLAVSILLGRPDLIEAEPSVSA